MTPEEVIDLLAKLRGVAPERLIDFKEVCNRVNFTRTSIEQMVARGEFPAPRKVGARAVAFLESEVNDWIRHLPRAGYKDGSRTKSGSQPTKP